VSFRIDSTTLYDASELEQAVGFTLWRRVKGKLHPLVRGRYWGADVAAALNSLASTPAAGVYTGNQSTSERDERRKRNGRWHEKGRVETSSEGPMRICLQARGK
jgi:hypothetical protein